MIRMIQSRSASQAKKYFNEALQKSDYYINDQELRGSFLGLLAERLNLKREVSKETFHFLCENIHPRNGNNLTPRKLKQRTVGYDINFHCPKSVSLLHVLSKDDHIINAFQRSVFETMKDIETDSKTRIRKNGGDENRLTGELLWAEFLHQTARPVKELSPDPHLHCHCFTFNMTWDKVEQQFKAAQFRFIKRDMPYYQAKFHKRLSDHLIKLGYRIRHTQNAFEIEGVPQNAIDIFSKRTNEIGRFAKENNITDEKELDALGGRTRSKKHKGLTMEQLKNDWRKQINKMITSSRDSNEVIIRHAVIDDNLKISSKECVDYSIQHCFERSSVVQDRRILEIAYRHGIGSSKMSVEDIGKVFSERESIIQVKDTDITFCTTHDVLEQEEAMINLACVGKGRFQPFYNICPSLTLIDEQAQAVQSILTTKDQVAIILGRAGTGKTTLMTEAVALIRKTGKEVFTVAPTSQAARGVLREEGFNNAETVARLLTDKDFQCKLKNEVLWVDEAGLLGVQDMAALLRLVVQNDTRLILSGDTGQHSSVARGDALRLISAICGLSTTQVSKIYRQKDKAYRNAVKAISIGDIESGFQNLDAMGSIIEIDKAKPLIKMVADYVAAILKGGSVLAVCPTHKQGEIVSNEIRKALKKLGKIGKEEINVSRFINLNFTSAEKSDSRTYSTGQVLQFNQNSLGVKRGSIWSVAKIYKGGLLLVNTENKTVNFSLHSNKAFDIFKEVPAVISKGDSLRITRNSFDVNKKKLNNGQELKFLGVNKKNQLRFQNEKSKNEYLVPKDFGHFNYAYCLTSHASQGKTVDEVLIFQPSETFPATDLKQFYVSVSRGRKAAKIYTDDKGKLFEQVSKPRNRLSSIELLKHAAVSISAKENTASNESNNLNLIPNFE